MENTYHYGEGTYWHDRKDGSDRKDRTGGKTGETGPIGTRGPMGPAGPKLGRADVLARWRANSERFAVNSTSNAVNSIFN